MTRRTFTVTLGSLELEARAEVTGEFRPAFTQADPEYCYPAESPEVDVQSLMLGETDLSGLLDDDDILESVHDQILGQLADEQFNGDQP
jgi:hypothetical protein